MKLVLSLLAVFVFSLGHSMAQHSSKDLISSRNWDIIGTTEFKEIKENEAYAKFSAEIKKHANKIFVLEGYLVPIDEGMKQRKFMLSTLPINQCYYCGSNGVPIMVYVEMVKPLKFTYRPIKIKGILNLSKKNVFDEAPVSLTLGNLVLN